MDELARAITDGAPVFAGKVLEEVVWMHTISAILAAVGAVVFLIGGVVGVVLIRRKRAPSDDVLFETILYCLCVGVFFMVFAIMTVDQFIQAAAPRAAIIRTLGGGRR